MNAIPPLPWPETSYRAGLLLGAVLFLAGAVGGPWSHGIFGFAALAVAALFVTIPASGWQALGDWREARRGSLLVSFALAIWIAVAAAITPSPGMTALPDGFESKLVGLLSVMKVIPLGSAIVGLAGAAISFAIFIVAMVCLMLGRRPGRIVPYFMAAFLLAGMLAFFHPSTELAIGLAFLGMFAMASREPALLLAPHVLESLNARQRGFLIYLREHGGIPAAEAPLLLKGTEPELRQLYDLRLIDWDEVTGEVFPGDRLMPNAAAEPAAGASKWLSRGVWLALGALYFIFPDILPGPIDDLVVMALCSYAGFRTPGSILTARASVSSPPPP